MGSVVYLLCAATALTCAVLLLRGFGRSGARLLLWSGVCFAGITLNNVLVFVDLVLVPDVSLATARSLTTLVSILVLLVGLVWESR